MFCIKKDRVCTANKLRAIRMEIWTIRGVDLSTLQDQLLGGCVVVPFNLPDLRGGVCTAGDGLQSLPTSSACQVVLWEHHCYCLNVFLLCLLTTVQFDKETLLRLSSPRRWCCNHWFNPRIQMHIFRTLVLLIMLLSYQGQELHTFCISHSCHKV